MAGAVVEFFRVMQPFPENITFWELLNSNLLSGILIALAGGAFTLVFKNESDRRLRQEAEKSKADEEALEARAIEISEGKPSFRAAADIVDDLKARVEDRVSSSDRRHQRTYSKITRYDYIPLINAMADRGLPIKIADLLREAFSIFRHFKNGRREVPLEALERLTKIQRELDSLGFKVSPSKN